jgi:hypothetical protein
MEAIFAIEMGNSIQKERGSRLHIPKAGIRECTDVEEDFWKLTNNIISTGRLGIWRIPSISIGSDTAAVIDAGIIITQDLLNRNSTPSDCLNVHLLGFSEDMCEDFVVSRLRIIYTMRTLRKARKAIVRAKKIRVDLQRRGSWCKRTIV